MILKAGTHDVRLTAAAPLVNAVLRERGRDGRHRPPHPCLCRVFGTRRPVRPVITGACGCWQPRLLWRIVASLAGHDGAATGVPLIAGFGSVIVTGVAVGVALGTMQRRVIGRIDAGEHGHLPNRNDLCGAIAWSC